jgi:hypothetical protein
LKAGILGVRLGGLVKVDQTILVERYLFEVYHKRKEVLAFFQF